MTREDGLKGTVRNEKDVCVRCRFFFQWESRFWTSAMHGECRKNAPTPADGFATVRCTDWCGEFSSKYPEKL